MTKKNEHTPSRTVTADDANLAAAAPDLLAALEASNGMLGKALERLADLGHGFGTAGTDNAADTWRKSRAAIARARGES